MNRQRLIELAVSAGAERFESGAGHDCITFVANYGELEKFAVEILLEAAIVCKLEGKVEKLRNALQRLIDVAEQCDSWESFPSKALEDAEKALGDSNDQ